METITRGTTPTIVFTFDDIDPTQITKAILSIKELDTKAVVLTRELAEISVVDGTIPVTLTQGDTLSVNGKAEILLNWKTGDGSRGTSKKLVVDFEKNHIDKVI